MTQGGALARQTGSAPTRELLLETTSAIMRERDMVDVSLSELSEKSGLNSALVKYHFGNKAGLLAALLDRDWRDIVAGVEALLAKDKLGPAEKLRRHVSAVIDTYYRLPYLNQLTLRMMRDSDATEARRIADCYLAPLYRAYERLIAEGVRTDVFRPVDPELLYFTITGAAERLFLSRPMLSHCFGQDTLTEELRDRYRAHTLDIIMAGILRREGG